MSKIRIVGGKYTKITGGTHEIYGKRIDYIAQQKVRNDGVQGGVHNTNNPKSPPVKENTFLIEGKWTDTQDKEITRTRVGNTVRFHIQTKGIPEGGKVAIQMKDYDGTVYLMYGFLPVKLYDEIGIVTTNKETGASTPFTHLTVDKEGKAVLTLNLDENLHPMIADDTGAFIELYVTCRYLNEKIDLPTSENKYLEVGFSEKTLFIKPAVKEGNYPLPEIYSHKGEIISYIINPKEKNIGSQFGILKIKTTEHFSKMSDVDAVKKTIYTEGIDISTGKTEFKHFHIEEIQNLYYSKIEIQEGNIFVDEELRKVNKIDKDTYLAYETKNKIIRIGQDASKLIDNYMLLSDMKEMIPALSSNDQFNKPSLSSFMFFLPPAISVGFTVLEYIATDMLRDFDEWYEEAKQLMLENAKMSGLTQVRNLLHMRRNTDFKNYRLLQNIPQITIEKLLKGEIKTFLQLDKTAFEDLTELNIKLENEENVNRTIYSVIIKYQFNDLRNDEISILESIIIQ